MPFIFACLGQLSGDKAGMVHFLVRVNGTERHIYPEDVGAIIISTLRQVAANNLSMPVTKAVMSVPAEFDERQRNHTRMAAVIAGRNACDAVAT